MLSRDHHEGGPRDGCVDRAVLDGMDIVQKVVSMTTVRNIMH